jgi:hypothetical protein
VALRHLTLITAASRHFPFGEGPESIRCRFCWAPNPAYDGYDVAKEIQNTKICVAGCFMVEAAAAFQQDSESGVKLAASKLAAAAALVTGGVDEAAMLEAVCLAQAQECFVWAAERSGKGGATVAALAWGACERLEVAEKLASSNKEWSSTLEKKRGLMFAVASCGEARDEDRTGMKHGEKIGRLVEGIRRLKTLSAAAGLEKQHAFYLEQSERLLRVHLKENDTIYFQRIGPGSAGAGKVLARPGGSSEDTEDLFGGLVSPHARARALRYGLFRDGRLQVVVGAAEKKSDEARARLSQLGLPGALDALESGVPPALRSLAEEVERAGGRARLEELHRTKAQLEQEAARLVAETTGVLDEEARLQGPSQTPSQLLTLHMRQELARLGAAREAGSASDRLVQRKLDELLPSLPLLARLDEALPRPAPRAGGAGHAELREALAKLDALLRERHALAATIKVALSLSPCCLLFVVCCLLFSVVCVFAGSRSRRAGGGGAVRSERAGRGCLCARAGEAVRGRRGRAGQQRRAPGRAARERDQAGASTREQRPSERTASRHVPETLQSVRRLQRAPRKREGCRCCCFGLFYF